MRILHIIIPSIPYIFAALSFIVGYLWPTSFTGALVVLVLAIGLPLLLQVVDFELFPERSAGVLWAIALFVIVGLLFISGGRLFATLSGNAFYWGFIPAGLGVAAMAALTARVKEALHRH